VNTLEEVENAIRERFKVLSWHPWFKETIELDNYELKEVLNFFDDVRGRRVLDVGCGKGRFCRILSLKGADVVGLDFVEIFLQKAKENVAGAQFVLGSVIKIPFPAETFDLLLCVETLQHIPDTKAAICEMVRVLKPNGRIIIIDKNLISLDPKWLLPSAIIKKYLELKGKWMYPKDFVFTEKRFLPGGVVKILKGLCQKAEVRYLMRVKYRRFKIRQILFLLLPFLCEDVAWEAIK
jgi:ubiquinone/menaquinone biosynthesis C-methylase UbiE